MKRSPLKVALAVLAYLAAGAAVNVLVAWGIAIWLQMPHYSLYQPHDALPASLHMVPTDWPPLILASRATAAGRAETQATFDVAGVPVQNGRCFIRHAQFGVPLLAMENWFLIEMPGLRSGQSAWENGIPIPQWVPRFMPYNTQYFGNLPLRPDMPGFAVNAVFYGVLLSCAVVFTQRARAALRRRRGQCARCGYELAGLAMCPECGPRSTQ